MNSLSGVRSNSPQQILEGIMGSSRKRSSRSDRLKGTLAKKRTPRRTYMDDRNEAISRLAEQMQVNFPQSEKKTRSPYDKDITPKGYSKGQLRQYTPEQFQLLERLIGQTKPDSYLSKLAGGDQSLFEEMERPALRQFAGLQGNIASRYAGRGTGGLKSSGFQNEIQQQASTFAQDLASRRQGLQQQAIKDLQGIGRELLQERPYERFLTPPKERGPSTKDQIFGIAGNFAKGAGQAIGAAALG